jgi:hypothetical protein
VGSNPAAPTIFQNYDMNTHLRLRDFVVISLLANGSGVMLDFCLKEAVRTPIVWIYPMEAYRLFFIVCVGLCLIALPNLLWLRQNRQRQ